MENKIIFAYDRKQDDFFVPNGYFVKNNFYDDIGQYITNTGHEPIVHPMFRGLQQNQFLLDDIKDNFIYPIEQFGAIEKLIGQENGYENINMFSNIGQETFDKIKSKNGKIVVFSFEESRVELQSIVFLHTKLLEYNINEVYYVTGNNWSIQNHYDVWCQHNNVKPKVIILNSFEQLYLKGEDLYDKRGTFVELKEIESKREKKFLCFNRRIRPHRYAMIAMFHHNNLLKNNLVSYSLEQGKDLNHLGNNGPDLNTMTQILGKTNLRDSYMSYYDELVNLSPMTIDYKNLTNVMGPGCENKEPYLQTYFSVVTETSFPEKIYFSTEKIYRPMLHFHPFIVYGAPHTLKNLKELGFKTFSPFIDESYDETLSPFKRMQKITKEIKRLCSMSDDEIHKWFLGMKDILIHNRNLMNEYGSKYEIHMLDLIGDIL
ncbi:MAG: hypothetical protein CMD25_00265 [Flavobacteriales bacterium]|nr:hypothetical protein [Flavobacteriales bacterium]|tara:strand:+ start:4196 stop:5488 length:1293 start_codon:yes stop_codon:yes gene_type:complete